MAIEINEEVGNVEVEAAEEDRILGRMHRVRLALYALSLLSKDETTRESVWDIYNESCQLMFQLDWSCMHDITDAMASQLIDDPTVGDAVRQVASLFPERRWWRVTL